MSDLRETICLLLGLAIGAVVSFSMSDTPLFDSVAIRTVSCGGEE
jgi:hypothetical protein